MLVFATMSNALPSAQTFTVLYSFSGEGGGERPQGGVTMDAAGSLYGTMYFGGRCRANIASSAGVLRHMSVEARFDP